MKKILLAAPLDYEISPLLKRLKKEKFKAVFQPLILGVGPKKSVRVLEAFLDQHPSWDEILIIGLAGALTSELKTGDIVIPCSVTSETEKICLEREGNAFVSEFEVSQSVPKSPLGIFSRSTLAAKRYLRVGHRFNRCDGRRNVSGKDIPFPFAKVISVPFITTPRILKPSEKAELVKENPGVKAVDMESFSVAKFLKEHNHHFRIIRAILDEQDYVFPDFRWIFMKNPFKDIPAFLKYAVCHPGTAAKVFDFQRKRKRALAKLAKSIVLFLRNKL